MINLIKFTWLIYFGLINNVFLKLKSSMIKIITLFYFHLVTGRKLNVHKTFRRRSGRSYVQLTSCGQGVILRTNENYDTVQKNGNPKEKLVFS